MCAGGESGRAAPNNEQNTEIYRTYNVKRRMAFHPIELLKKYRCTMLEKWNLIYLLERMVER